LGSFARTGLWVRHPLPALTLALVLLTAATAGASSARWSIAHRDGVAWLVTPTGQLFFSIGVNSIDGGGDGDAAYDWTRVAPSYASWLDATRVRLARWGFNTAGPTSTLPDELRLPVIPDLELGRTARFHWVDPFHPATATRMRVAARRLVAPYAGRPERIGYFSDNEVGWWSGALFAFYLEQPRTNVTKRRLVGLLRRHYDDDWQRFARDFTPPPGARSFAGILRARATSTLRPGGHGLRVVERWTRIVARRYYTLVRRSLHAADPDALLFGDRLPIYYDPAAVRAMAPHVDAIATNYNVDSPDGWIAPYFFDGLRRLSHDEPVLISEWFFAAAENRTGNRNNGHLMTVQTQDERARGAAAAAVHFARQPSIVGAHWFQYYDHPRGGRSDDGEDYNFGLVDVADRPYVELVSALGRVNPTLAGVHRYAAERQPPAAGLPRASIDVDDGSLADWPKDDAVLTDLEPGPGRVPFANVLAAWNDDALSLAVVGMDYPAPEIIVPHTELPHAECFHVEWGIDAGDGPRRVALYFVPPPAPAGKARYTMRVDICRSDDGGCEPVPGARARYFGADQPRLVAELRLPWSALGVAHPPRAIRMALAVTGFHRGRWMTTGGRPPRPTLAAPERWPRRPLAG